MKRSRMADHALVLLDYVSKHPEEKQTLRSLSEATGIPFTTIHYLLEDDRNTTSSILSAVAYRYRFKYHVYPKETRGKLISAVYVGYGNKYLEG